MVRFAPPKVPPVWEKLPVTVKITADAGFKISVPTTVKSPMAQLSFNVRSSDPPLFIVIESQVTDPQVKESSPRDEDKVKSMPSGSTFPLLLMLSVTLRVVILGKVSPLRVKLPVSAMVEPVMDRTAPTFLGFLSRLGPFPRFFL